jgi:predicted MPP superfamily phosphohydrolase
MNNKTYFISSDIHSFYKEWIEALTEFKFNVDNPNHIIIVVGDLFDRGQQAVECYKFVKELNDNNRLIYIKGNHEDLLFDCVKELQETGGCASPHHWSNGTVDTIVQLKEKSLLEEVLQFIKDNAIDYYELKNYVFTHAGLPLKLTYENNKPVMVIDKNAGKEKFTKHRWDNPIKNLQEGYLLSNKVMVVGHWHCSALWHYLYPEKYSDFNSFGDLPMNFDICKNDNLIMIDACTTYTKKVNVLKIEER